MQRTLSWIVALAAVVGAGALVSACSAIVSPDTSRLHPEDELDGGRVDPPDAQSLDAQPGPDGSSMCPAVCDDGVACTTDTCVAASCQHLPDDSLCGDGERCNPAAGCVPARCTADAECSDGNACNGAERCDPDASTEASGCVPGMAVVCDDGYACTDDSCDPTTGACTAAPVDARCDDGVACTTDRCSPGGAGDGCTHAGDDSLCDDGFCFTGGSCHPTMGCIGSMPRSCDDGDACDVESCDPVAMACVSAPRDADMDGHPAARVPTPFGSTSCAGGTDCDDSRAEVYPGAAEICGNGRDDDCDGTPDDGCTPTLNETCPTATPIVLDPTSRSGSATGSYSSYANDASTSCGSTDMPGRDAWYYFDVTALSDVVIDTSGTASAGQDPVLAVAFDCAAGTVVCNDDQDLGANIDSRIFLHRIAPPAGTASLRVYVMVDAYDSRYTGTFRVNVRVFPARADSCSSEPLDITGGGTVLGVGPYGAITSSQYGSCQSWGERGEGEAVLRIRSPGDGEIEELTAYSRTFTPDIYLRGGPCSSGFERDCDQGGSVGGGLNVARLQTVSVPVDTNQYLFVDGMLGTTSTGAPHSYILAYDP